MAKPRVVALRTGEEIELTVWLKPLRKSAPRVSSELSLYHWTTAFSGNTPAPPQYSVV